MQSLKKKTDGFTIIEVMIVLVIAAVIILIVFLAVPALQRNSRNNQRRNDVSRIAAAVTETANNDNGTLPDDWDDVSANAGNLGFYEDSVEYTTNTLQVTDENEVLIRNSVTCGTDSNGDQTAVVDGSARQFVVLYAVETGGDTQPQCTEG